MDLRKDTCGLKSGYMPEWWSALKEEQSVEAQAVKFMTLTGRRAEEVIEMKPTDLDLKKGIWRIEVSPHWDLQEVPLSGAARELAGVLVQSAHSATSIFPDDGCGGRTIFDAMAAITYRNPCAVELRHENRMGEIADYPIRCAFHRWAEKQGFVEHDVNMALDIRNSMDDEVDPSAHALIVEAWAKYLEDPWWMPKEFVYPETSMPF